MLCFNPRTRTGCDKGDGLKIKCLLGFNPRTRTGCDVRTRKKLRHEARFNPRTRTGCDVKWSKDYVSAYVSIHAPARGATLMAYNFTTKTVFQSTHPHGVRHRLPTWGAMLCLFQSTHPHGVGLSVLGFGLYHKSFQSTHPHGVRRRCSRKCAGVFCFNPRTRTGCDLRTFPYT